MAKLNLKYLEELLALLDGKDVAMFEAGEGEDHVKLVFHQTFPEQPQEAPTADESPDYDEASYSAQLLGDDTPKFNREA